MMFIRRFTDKKLSTYIRTSQIAFAPGWLGTPLHAGTSVTRGIPIGVGVIVISFVLTGIYIWRANGEFDRLNNAVLHEVKAL